MRGLLKSAAALLGLAAAPLAADSSINERREVMNSAHAFFGALRSADKTALARHMIPDGTIFVHDRKNPDAPRVDAVPVADHLKRWENSPQNIVEWVRFETVLVDGDMAQIWGPYYFTIAGKLTHCGTNSLSMVKTDDGWKVANTSFTMEAPETCDDIVKRVQESFVRTVPDPR